MERRNVLKLGAAVGAGLAGGGLLIPKAGIAAPPKPLTGVANEHYTYYLGPSVVVPANSPGTYLLSLDFGGVPANTQLARMFWRMMTKGPNEPYMGAWIGQAGVAPPSVQNDYFSLHNQRCDHWDSGTTLNQTMATDIVIPRPGLDRYLYIAVQANVTAANFQVEIIGLELYY